MKPDVHTQNTESNSSPVIKPCVPNTLKERGPTPPEEATAPVSFTLPNPYVQKQCGKRVPLWNQRDQSSSGKRSFQTSVQKSVSRDGQWSNTPNKHGYSSSRPFRGATQDVSDTAPERSSREKHRKESRPSTEPVSQGKSTRKPLEVIRNEGSRASRSATKSTERNKPWQGGGNTFEVNLSDFPKLDLFAPGKSTLVPHEPQPPSSAHCQDPSSPSKSRPGAETEEMRSVFHREPVLPSSGLQVASWASVASQCPRKPTLVQTARPTSSSQNEINPELEMENVSEKKRKKKKKKKSKRPNDVEVEKCTTPIIDQEPPKFQDEEEFPELGLSSVSSARGQNPSATHSNMAKRQSEVQNYKESVLQRDVTALQPEDQKGRPAAGKPSPPSQLSETKNGQKAEKTNGKKSKAPVQLDLGNMFAVLEQKQQAQKSKRDPKPIILSVGGALPMVHKDTSVQKKHPRLLEKVAHNPLDSTSPLVKKGKQREVPKAKKPTPLKRIILKEREERKQTRLLEEMGLAPQTSKPSTNPNKEPQETPVSEQDQQDQTGCTDKGTDLDPQPQDSAPLAEHKPGGGNSDAEDTTEECTPPEICSPTPPKIHSRKFRDYCSQMLSKDVDECVTILLKELVRFQDRLYQKDPMKARMKRRLVMGLREVLKHLKLRKVKCVIISPNCERIQSKGGLDEALHTIIDTCLEQSVPFVFALSRKALGRCVNKAVPVSLVGIFNYDGAQDHYHKMIELSSQARKAYEVMITNMEKLLQDQEENRTDEQSIDSTIAPTETEEPEYIKIWKRMLEKECNHHFLNFEEQLATTTMSSDVGLQVDGEDRS